VPRKHGPFERSSPEQKTISLLVLHKGEIVLERYADGFDMTTRTRTWSTAKSIASTLIGMKVDSEELALDTPLSFEWLPTIKDRQAPGPTWRHHPSAYVAHEFRAISR
jgi:CubicO group peptidase (beta-lactamase class C family)